MVDPDQRVWCLGWMSGMGDFAAKVRSIDLIDRPPIMTLVSPIHLVFAPQPDGRVGYKGMKLLSNFKPFTGELDTVAEWQASGNAIMLLRPASVEFGRELDKVVTPPLIQPATLIK